MWSVEGKSILKQVALGRLCYFQRTKPELEVRSRRSVPEELERFDHSRLRAVSQLMQMYRMACSQVGEQTASIFSIHAMLLEDEDFFHTIQALVRDKGLTAEYAVYVTGESFAAAFAAMDSAYMRARAVDFRDISLRMIRCLTNCWQEELAGEEPVILVADEFLPSEVFTLNKRALLGLVSQESSVDSHTYQLLQVLGIPALAQVQMDREWDGHLALLDGFDGKLYVDPERDLTERLRLRYQDGGRPGRHKKNAVEC